MPSKGEEEEYQKSREREREGGRESIKNDGENEKKVKRILS